MALGIEDIKDTIISYVTDVKSAIPIDRVFYMVRM